MLTTRGRVVGADEAHKFAREHKMVNGKEAVRARCVVQDIEKREHCIIAGIECYDSIA